MRNLEFETAKMRNARDLGGIAVQGGVIKPHLLIRTNALADADEHEVRKLAEVYRPLYVIDLRATAEADKDPDPMHLLPDSEYVSIPLAADSDVGIVRKGSLSEALDLIHKVSDDPIGMMTGMYRDIVSSERGQKALRKVFDLLLKADGRGVVWHCTAGKDRAGITAALILLALGASREDVYADYMLTNEFMEPYLEKQRRQMRFAPSKVKRSLEAMNEANPEFLDAALSVIGSQYGGVDAYLENQIGLREGDLARLRSIYIERA